VSAPVAAAAPPAPPDVDEVEGMVLTRLNAKDAGGLFFLFGDGMRKAVPLEKLEAIVNGEVASWGALTSPRRIDGSTDRSHARYSLKGAHGEYVLELGVDAHGAIAGLRIEPAKPGEPPVARSDVPLALPFRGKWTVRWGGDTLEVNQHVRSASQRRAADLVVSGEDGKSYKGEGKLNTDYYAYGKEILAAADGEVTTVIDGVPENEPGTLNPTYLGGNEVFVRHTPALYSVYAHLIPGRIHVKVGAKVHKGDVLGLCGNSGNASEPHLHFQLEDGPRFEASWGVLPIFTGVQVTRGGKTARSDAYQLLKGDTIEPAPR